MSSIQPANNDFAATLLINKMANGQITTSSGRTVTTKNLQDAQALTELGKDFNNVSNATLEGAAHALSRQNTLSEVRSIFSDMNDLIETLGTAPTTSQITNAASTITTMQANIDSLLGGMYTKADGSTTALFGDAQTYETGFGAATITLNGTDYGDTDKLLGTTNGGLLTAAAGATDIAALTALGDEMSDILNGIDTLITAAGADYNMMNNHSIAMDDLVQNFNTAASAQDSVSGTGAASLLNSVLGVQQA